MADARLLQHIIFVDLDAQPRPVRYRNEAILILEYFSVADVVEQVVALVVVDAQALFLNEGVVADAIQLQARSQRNRPERAMQRQRHVVGLGHAGDLARLGDAASMRGVRLNDVDVALGEDAFEIPARIESLTQRDGRAG